MLNQRNHGSGLSPGPPHFPKYNTHNFKYMCVGIENKEPNGGIMVSESYEVFAWGKVTGSNPTAAKLLTNKPKTK
jgi:hypothetical protein